MEILKDKNIAVDSHMDMRPSGGDTRVFPAWFHRHLSPSVFLMALGGVVGLLAGVAAFLLKKMIAWVSGALTGCMRADGYNWLFLLLPVIGILLTGIFQRYILHRNITHGEEQMNNDIRHHRYKLPFELTFAPMLAGTLTLGFGGSAGSEGPIAYVGGAIGSNIARWFGMSVSSMKVLLACGAGAGIAGIFMAPVGGAMFAFEVLCVQLSMMAVLAVFVSALTAGLTTYVLMGCHTDVVFAMPVGFEWHMLPWVLLLGLFCGFYSYYYAAIMVRMRRWYDSFRNPWVENVVSGAIVGLFVFIFPVLYGEGYGFITKVLGGDAGAIADYGPFARMLSGPWLVIALAGGVMLIKAFATSSTNCGGGVAGDFAPTLFAGCITGYFFAATLNTLFALAIPETDFALFGMAAVMAGTIRAPLMAMFLAVEMTQRYELLLPAAIVATISFGVVLLLNRKRA